MKCHPFVFVVLLGVALVPISRPAASLAADPFAPPGTELVRIEIAHRGVVQQLLDLGLRPEEGGRDYLLFRVTPAELAQLRALGFPVSVVPEVEPSAPSPSGGMLLFTTYSQMVAELNQLVADHPSIAMLDTIGQSVQSRNILAVKITRNPTIEEFEPEVRIVGAHHGNEKMSVEMCLNMAQHLTDNYGIDPQVTSLVNTREIWIVPMVNPDGVEANSRYNSHSVDLNRNYGYMWEGGGSSNFSEPETRATRQLATDNWFVLSLSFHTSGDVVNSLWNYTPHYAEDDAVIWTLTEGYAAYNGYWAVRGWYWYETHGDCNDWSYGARADMDWTIEIANSGETTVWNKNRDAMLYIMSAAGWGVHGMVTDATTRQPLRARVWVSGNGWPAFTDPVLGDYHKPLLAGTYTLRFSANGYGDVVVPGVVVPAGGGTTLNIALTRGGGRYADRVEIANVADPNNDYTNMTLTMAMLGAPDGAGCSIGRGGSVVLDFGPGSEARDIAGADLRVVESTEDAAGDGYTLYGGSSYLGPWTLIGTGSGTRSFDLAGTGLSPLRYVRVVDDGDGTAGDPYAGFDLDAVESFGGTVTAVAEPRAGEREGSLLTLAPPSPNPVPRSGATEILFEAPATAPSRLDVFDAQGRLVTLLAEGVLGPGPRRVSWRSADAAGNPLATGLYFVRLSSENASTVRKLLVVR